MTQALAGPPGDMDHPSVMDTDAVAAALEVDVEAGLSAQEAARRLAQNGPNELRATPRAPAWRRVLAQFQDPLIYLLLARRRHRAGRLGGRGTGRLAGGRDRHRGCRAV